MSSTSAYLPRVMQAKLSERKYHDLRCVAYLGFLSQISGRHVSVWFSRLNLIRWMQTDWPLSVTLSHYVDQDQPRHQHLGWRLLTHVSHMWYLLLLTLRSLFIVSVAVQRIWRQLFLTNLLPVSTLKMQGVSRKNIHSLACDKYRIIRHELHYLHCVHSSVTLHKLCHLCVDLSLLLKSTALLTRVIGKSSGLRYLWCF